MNNTDNRKNIVYGFIYQFLFIIFGFLLRRTLLSKAGVYLIGVNGVFENIMAMIDLVDLGISSSCMYFLYEAFSNKNNKKAYSYFQCLKNQYRKIALIISIIGIFLIFKIDLFIDINPNISINYIRCILLIHLLRAVSFYLLTSYKWTLQCDGKRYYSYQSDIVALIIFSIVRFIFLEINGDIVIYLLLTLIEMILSNLYVVYRFKKRYKTIFISKKIDITEEKNNVTAYAKPLAVNNIDTFINNCTDNLVIGKICGAITVGFMSNYYLIMDSVKTVLLQFFSSIEANVYKRFYASKSSSEKESIYNETLLFSFTAASFSSIFLLGLTNIFISLYFGNNYSIGNFIPLLMCINIALIFMQYPSKYMLSVNGLLNKMVFVSTIMVISNIGISIWLTYIIGPQGALIGTFVANIIYTLGQDIVIKKNTNQLTNKTIMFKILFYFLIGLQLLIVYKLIPSFASIQNMIFIFIICLLVFIIFELPWIKKYLLIFKNSNENH